MTDEQRKERYDIAREHFQCALDILLKNYDHEHPVIAQTYNLIGVACENSGNYMEAISYIRQALELHTKVLGEEHIVTLRMYRNMGRLYFRLSQISHIQEDIDEAWYYNNKALNGYQKQYENNTAAVKDVLCRLEILVRQRGQ